VGADKVSGGFMIRYAVFLLVLLTTLPLAAQTYVVGGTMGVASNATESINPGDHNFDTREFHFGWFMEDDTLLVFRYGQIENAGDYGSVGLDFDYYAFTVDYIFVEKFFTSGVYLGPAYYDGTGYWALPWQETPVEKEESKIGATAGIESFIPLSTRVDLTFQISAHYLPLEEEDQVTVGILGGFSFKF